MKKNIIYFDVARLQRALKATREDVADQVGVIIHADFESTVTAQNRKFNNYVDLQSTFSQELKYLKSKYNTRSPKFMFPSTLCNYRKDINPVTALYLTLQNVLLTYDSLNNTHKWVLSLFDDPEWKTSLISAINKDINRIKDFCNKFADCTSTYIQKELHSLVKKHQEYKLFLEVINMLQEWKQEYCI